MDFRRYIVLEPWISESILFRVMDFRKYIVRPKKKTFNPGLPEKTQIWVEIREAVPDINKAKLNPIEVGS